MSGPRGLSKEEQAGLDLAESYVRWSKVLRREIQQKGVWRGLGVVVRGDFGAGGQRCHQGDICRET